MDKTLQQQNIQIRDAQYRKGLSIAFFNANNLAITLVSTDKEYYTEDELKVKIISWRNFFLKEHEDYYSKVISPIGCLYDKNETIKLIESATGMEDLKDIWLSLSQDERNDVDIIKIKDEIKKKYENI
jgi:hypothetical protein